MTTKESKVRKAWREWREAVADPSIPLAETQRRTLRLWWESIFAVISSRVGISAIVMAWIVLTFALVLMNAPRGTE